MFTKSMCLCTVQEPTPCIYKLIAYMIIICTMLVLPVTYIAVMETAGSDWPSVVLLGTSEVP